MNKNTTLAIAIENSKVECELGIRTRVANVLLNLEKGREVSGNYIYECIDVNQMTIEEFCSFYTPRYMLKRPRYGPKAHYFLSKVCQECGVSWGVTKTIESKV